MVAMGEVSEADLSLDRDIFMRTVLRELTGSLQDIVGMAEASGYISVVGTALGEQIDGEYRRALAVEKLSQAQVRDVLVDLKRRRRSLGLRARGARGPAHLSQPLRWHDPAAARRVHDPYRRRRRRGNGRARACASRPPATATPPASC
jgi:hypothetical protein